MDNSSLNEAEYDVNWRQYHFQASSDLNLDALKNSFIAFLSPHPLVQTAGRLPNQPFLAVLAQWQGRPSGLVVVEKLANNHGLIICWHVLKQHRRHNLGQQLLKKIEHVALSHKLTHLSLSFREDSTYHPQIRHILNKLNWQPPKKTLMLYKFSADLFVKMSWCQQLKIPDGFEIFDWHTLLDKEINFLKAGKIHGHIIPENLSPFVPPTEFERCNSIGLRYQNQVVGWLLTHRVHEDVIEYSRLFVSPKLQPIGRGILLIAESIKRQHKLGITRGIFQVKTNNSAMIAFVEKRMKPSISAQTGRMYTTKVIQG